MPEELRAKILSEFAKYTGQIKPAAFFKWTHRYIPEIDRFHNLITGIFKPAWSGYALCILIKQGSIYEDKDEFVFLDDGRWLMTYSPRKGGLEIPDNVALANCMQDKVPVGVIAQITPKTHKKSGSTYQILGLGIVTDYNPIQDVFEIQSIDWDTLENVTSIMKDEEERYQVQLYAQLANEFRPFVKEELVTYSVSAPKREASFRKVLLQEYQYTCAICNLKFKLDNLVEAQAVHIVPKKENGTDDPRNGIAMCRTHHWAFDNGIFSLTNNREIILSEKIYQAELSNFPLVEMNHRPILLPQNELIRPHSEALTWHRNYHGFC
ncbi:MAG: HNH endonuclease [Anaerolineae bacterium]|nr:HNH endonuclease [Anaerolineae bacterium]